MAREEDISLIAVVTYPCKALNAVFHKASVAVDYKEKYQSEAEVVFDNENNDPIHTQ